MDGPIGWAADGRVTFRDPRLEESLRDTRATIAQRLADPGIAAPQRWTLQQWATFLSGFAPAPDTRPRGDLATHVAGAAAPLPARSRRPRPTRDHHEEPEPPDEPEPIRRVRQRPLDAWRCVRA
jgi:hypothetical protein